MRRLATPLLVAFVCAVLAAPLFGGAAGGGGARTAFLPGNAYAGAGGLNGIADADCTQWRAGTRAQRRAVVAQLGEHFERPTEMAKGARMPDAEAHATLDRACAERFASAFKLYKIYARALAFRAAR